MIALCAAALAATPPLPSPDPLGFPAPAPLMQGLSYLTLSLHLTAMSFTLGGLLLLLWARWRGRAGHDAAARFWRHALPLGFSYLVTFGVPPLLFVQVLYGQLFYSSSVLVGAFWITVIPLLLVAYTGLYLHKLGATKVPRPQTAILVASILAMLGVGFIYVNNFTLSMTPSRWAAKYLAHPGGGALHLEEATLWPRYLLFMLASLSVAGLALVIAGAALAARDESGRGRALRHFGLRAFLLGRVLVAGAGIVLLATLAAPLRLRLLSGGLATWLLAAALLAALAATLLTLLAVRRARLAPGVGAALLLLCEVGALVALRDEMRLASLQGVFALGDVPVRAQWGMLAIFAFALVVGLLLLVWVTVRVAMRLAAATREEPSAPAAPRHDRAA